MRTSNIDDQIQVLAKHLVGKYGPVIGYPGFAEIIGTTPGALRLRQSRRGDLPPSIPGAASCLWPVPAVAEWLISVCHDSPPSAPPKRAGRPRKQPRVGG